jgi:uncharacterized phage protein (TIGR01671 family)
MSRQIKFRAWDGSKMEYNVMAGFLGAFYAKGIDENDAACISPFNTIYDSDTPIMQFTGLLDKNGNEIYEGDIIKTTTDKLMCITWSERFASFCIERDGWAFQHWFGEAMEANECEIIGNIHESPELLTK